MRYRTSKTIYRYLLKGSLISLILIIMTGTAAALAASLPEDMAELMTPEEMTAGSPENGIVRIVAGTVDDNGSFSRRSTASGFIVSREGNTVYIVTAMHSVDYGSEGSVRVVIKNDSTVEATIEQPFREKDFCILSAEDKFRDKDIVPVRVSALDPEGERLSEGDEVTALGYPASLGSSSEFSAADVSGEKGKAVSGPEGSGYIKFDAKAPDGFDGGPLTDKDGYAVGLVNSKIYGGSGALDISDVDAALYKEGLTYRSKDKDLMYSELYELCAGVEEQYDAADKDTRERLTRVWKESVELMQEAPYDRDRLSRALSDYKELVSVGGRRMETPLKIVIALAAVIVFLSVKLIMLILWNDAHGKVPDIAGAGVQPALNAGAASMDNRERRSGARNVNAGRSAPASARSVNAGRNAPARLMLLKTGEVFTLNAGVTSLGKSSDSDISIQYNKKVSRHHARIEYRNGGYYLRDLNSTNGSYVNGVSADAAGVMLKAGDIIRLADEELQFLQ